MMNKIFEKLSFFKNPHISGSKAQREDEFDSLNKITSIFIHYGQNSKLEIKIPDNLQRHLTCAWLLEEATNKIKKTGGDLTQKDENATIVTLKTKNNDFAVDHLLNDPKQDLAFLRSGTILEPYYGVNTRSLDEFGNKVELSDFEIETKLGYGAFSNVYLARRKANGKLYALKQVKKGDLSRRKRKMLERERNSLIEMNCPFIVPLRWIFQTTNFCYFVIDFVPCGDLHHLLEMKKRLSEAETKFFISEAILGLNAIHTNNFLYRDLKPENLLLTLDGHVQITDFGLVKKVNSIHDPNHSQCGTLEIMAPEIIKDQGHNCLADYYNVGTLAFELVTGRVPTFRTEDRSFDDRNLLESFDVSLELQDFICRLLDSNTQTRLGAQKGLNEICTHPWLKGINMLDVAKKRLKTPFKVDPYTVKFKVKKINYDIDETEDYFNEYMTFAIKQDALPERNLFNFSFYGFGEDDSPDRVALYKNPPSFTKIPTVNNISTAYSPYTCSTVQMISATKGINRFNTTNDFSKRLTTCTTATTIVNDKTEEVADESELVVSKLKKYLPGGTKDTKLANNLKKLSPYFNSANYLNTCHI